MGIALTILLIGLGLLFLYYIYLKTITIPSGMGMGALIYIIPLILVAFCLPPLYFYGYKIDLLDTELSSTVKITEGIIGVFVLFAWLIFLKKIS